MLEATNKPYVKQYEDKIIKVEKPNLDGKKGDPLTIMVDVTEKVIVNPIHKRYSNDGSNRSSRKNTIPRLQVNRKGTRLIVHKGKSVAKAFKPRIQIIGNKSILHYDIK